MNRLALVLAIVIAIPIAAPAQRKRALMVGISSYRKHGYKVWNNIHGAEDVALLRPELEKKGFHVQAVTNGQATRHGIVRALDAFIAATKSGDTVYLHFSCHGQPVEDGLNGMAKDEKDGWDESIVPIDAGKAYNAAYKGEKHITDDELNTHISKLRKQIGPEGMLFVAMDACHAGNMERDDFETTRGTNEGLTKNPQNKYNPTDTPKRSRPVQSPDFAPVVYIEACESSQRNQEITYQGKEYGALSFNIFQMLLRADRFPKTLQEFKAKLSANILFNKKQRNRLWPAGQTVVFED